MRRLRADHEEYELRRAVIRVASKPFPCDMGGCESHPFDAFDPSSWRIQPGTEYAYISTGLKLCPVHWLASDVEVTP